METPPSSIQLISSLCSWNRPILPRRASTTVLFERRSTKAADLLGCQEAKEQLSTDHSHSHNQVAPKPNSSTERRSPKRPAICGFLPLASITASPVCSPVSTCTNTACDITEEKLPSSILLEYSSSPEHPDPHSPHTWISTLPTPALEPVLGSAIGLTQSPSCPFPPSASFPASMPPHAPSKPENDVKRSMSAPDMSQRLRASSEPFASSKRPRTSQGSRSSPGTRSQIYPFKRGINEATPQKRESFASPSSTNWDFPSPGDIHYPRATKDVIRKFYALKELLSTEIGYLMDLKALYTIYLYNLPTVASRSPTTSSSIRASMSFTAGPWMNSYSQLQAQNPSSPNADPQKLAPLTSLAPARESLKSTARCLLSDSDIALLTRNSSELLRVHEEFVNALQEALEPLGFVLDPSGSMDDLGNDSTAIRNVDAAIQIVCEVLASHGSQFDVYQSFCADHPAALDLVRRAVQQHPSPWDAFEHRCSVLVSNMLEANMPYPELLDPEGWPLRDPSRTPTSPTRPSCDRRRAMSLSSSDITIRRLQRRPSGTLPKGDVAFPTDSRKEKATPRIAFMDYMIKPIQRICKYPLLIDQLRSGKPTETLSATDELVDKALSIMKEVARAVDEARHKQDIATQSSLILSRIFLTGALLAHPSSSRHPPPPQMLTVNFFSSLGSCVFAGSLDVLHYHPLSPLESNPIVTAKYLGAFLYPGGYLILAKISKGKKYEPKHWFSLNEFEICEVGDNQAMLAFSFRLSSGEQHYELGAACQREKNAWLNAMHESITQTPTWVDEPTPSFRFDSKGEFIPPASPDEASSPGTPLNDSDMESAEPAVIMMKSRKKAKRQDSMPWHDRPSTPGYRASPSSVISIFSQSALDSENIEVRRPTSAARLQVDHDMQDVISQVCVSARSYAFSRDEELFPAPSTTRTILPRTNSGISISGMAKTRLTRYDSIKIPRRKSMVDGVDSQLIPVPPIKRESLGSKKNTKRLSITSVSFKDFETSPPGSDSASLPSSQASSIATSILPGGNSGTAPSSSPSSQPTPTAPPLERRRSLVRNVKGFFQSVTPMTVIVSPRPSTIDSDRHPGRQAVSLGMLSRWKRGSLRRRSALSTVEDRMPATIV
ncbi:hypothetical protein BDQ12DRAFT_718928 [Crucibulum laeve]|uniref:DH domain-containing protein n=1 Tax=Crucibulum laeve TaxID=68775 RepID=A0A5C3MGE1_9AGAR|nr:hypothetical protein BDQ12DRAFT_718928 [Crucibulum laeve]